MTLTEAQVAALQQREPVTLLIEEVGVACVIVRADRFTLSSTTTDHDWPEVARSAVLKAWDAVGSPNDGLLYQISDIRVEPESTAT